MSSQVTSILVVDDDPAFRRGLRASLQTGGYCVETVRSGEQALEFVRERPVDIVLLDINMPGMGGIEACRRIRNASSSARIVMLTVRDEENDKVTALDAGADDYITKPFHLRELVARLRAILRRRERTSTIIRAGNLELEQRVLRKQGRDIHLTPKEFELLALLMRNKDIPLTHARIMRTVCGPDYRDEPDYLRAYVKNVRKKIEDDPAHPEYILTEP